MVRQTWTLCKLFLTWYRCLIELNRAAEIIFIWWSNPVSPVFIGESLFCADTSRWTPTLISKHPHKNIKSPSAPQRRWACLSFTVNPQTWQQELQLHQWREPQFVGHGKIRANGRGEKGVPGTLKGRWPVFPLPFLRNYHSFFVRERRSPRMCKKFLRFF